LQTGLFSAAVAALAAVSIQDLRPNSQDITAFYVANIYQLLADPNVSRASILATPAKPPLFSPPKYAIWVNSLWFLSLVISLTCALLATLLQQWARRYLTATQPTRYSPHKRARIRAFFADGVEKFHLPWAVETLPTLLHISLFLFFSGLLVFLFNINHTTFSVVVWWIGLSGGVYGCITLMPIFRHDSPYYAPLSLSAWFVYNGVIYGVCRIRKFITYLHVFSVLVWRGTERDLAHTIAHAIAHDTEHDTAPSMARQGFGHSVDTFNERLLGGIAKKAQETALKLSAEIDGQVLKWTFDSLDEDHELEQFFEGIPGFCVSKVVNAPRRILAELDNSTLTAAFEGFLDRTCSSSLLSERARERRVKVCMLAVDALDCPFPFLGFLFEVFQGGMDGVLRSVQMGHSLRSRCCSSDSDSETAFCAQWIVSGIIAMVPERDYRWKALVMDQLGVSEDVLRDYLAHGDSVLLANLIHITHQFFRFFGRLSPLESFTLSLIQRTISKFDIQTTLPGLQHDFCGLWNEISLQAHNDGSHKIPFYLLRCIRHLYVALHQGTDAAPTAFSTSTADDDHIFEQPSSYPLCNIPGHQPHIHETTYPPTITSPTVSPPVTVPNSITSSTGPYVSSFPASTSDHSGIHPVDKPSLDNVPDATPIIGFFHLSPPANVENHHDATTSLDPATTENCADTSPLSIPFPSSSTADPQYNTDLRLGVGDVLPSMLPGIQLSSSPTPDLSDALPGNPQRLSASPASRIEQIAPGPRSLSLSSAPTIPFTIPLVTSVSQANSARNDATLV
jgi:Family of unknown function (DUF6535)